MTLKDQIAKDLKSAMKAKDETRVSCLRMLKTSLKHWEVEQRREASDEDIHGILSSLVKKAKEAAEDYRKGNREDLARKEESELQVFYEYLPRQLSPAEIETILKDVIKEVSASSVKDLGKVMRAAMGRMAGQAQGKEVNEIARRLLA